MKIKVSYGYTVIFKRKFTKVFPDVFFSYHRTGTVGIPPPYSEPYPPIKCRRSMPRITVDMGSRHQMMEKRMEMLQVIMKMMRDRMSAAPAQ